MKKQLLAAEEEPQKRRGKRDKKTASGKKASARKNAAPKPARKDAAREKPGKNGALPPVCVLDIVARERDGILLARPHSSAANSSSAPNDGNDAAQLVALPPSPKMPAAGVGSRILAKIFPAKGEDKQLAPYQGRIIRVLDKQIAEILAIIRAGPGGHLRLEPINRKQPELLLPADALGSAQIGDLVLAAPLGGGRGHAARQGKIKQIIGAAAEEKALSEIALYSHSIPAAFPPSVLAEAEAAAGQKPAGRRQDWRHIPFVTIDPQTAKDHDDAVFAAADSDKNNPGGHRILVAIADVAAYVRPHSAMNGEARKRGNSVYFPDRVVPMLPEQISNNLCSLREGEDRPALAAEIIITAQGRVLRHKFHRILMKSHAKLSYEQAQAAIDGKADAPAAALTETVLRPLWAAHAALKQARQKRQPLELNLPERKIILNEAGRVGDIRIVPRLDAHRLVEDFMIAANSAAAETLKAKRRETLYRIHDSPSPMKREGLRDFLQSIGIKFSPSGALSPEQFNHILAKAAGKDYEELVNQVILRAQAQAEYSTDNIGHFGLKLRDYAHFTSPIRRYADLLVHRGLIAALNLGQDGITAQEEAELGAIAEEISAAERRAQLAERETNDRLIAHYLSANIGAHFSGRINGVTRAGLFVTLDRTGADGLAPISGLKDKDGQKDFYHFDEAHFALVGAQSRLGYQLGDMVEVRLLEVQKAAGSLRFEILSPPRKLPFSIKSFHKAGRGRKPQRPGSRKPR